ACSLSLSSCSPAYQPFLLFFLFLLPRPPRYTLFPYTTLFRSKLTENSFLIILFNLSAYVTIANSSKQSLILVIAILNSSLIYMRSEEHTSELQSRFDLVCRLLLEKKKNEKIDVRDTGKDMPNQ